jgi:hypothetical protein
MFTAMHSRKIPNLWPHKWISYHDNSPYQTALSLKGFLAVENNNVEPNTTLAVENNNVEPNTTPLAWVDSEFLFHVPETKSILGNAPF